MGLDVLVGAEELVDFAAQHTRALAVYDGDLAYAREHRVVERLVHDLYRVEGGLSAHVDLGFGTDVHAARNAALGREAIGTRLDL